MEDLLREAFQLGQQWLKDMEEDKDPISFNEWYNSKQDVIHNASSVLDVIKTIPQQRQVQYDLQRQLRELRVAANKLGLYDAADFIRH
jgi:hypothetical protein